jgi:hypothetical protein
MFSRGFLTERTNSHVEAGFIRSHATATGFRARIGAAMNKRLCKRRGRPGRKRLVDEHCPQLPPTARETKPKIERLNPSYASGPVVHMRADENRAAPREAEQEQDLPSLALRSTEATKHETTVSGDGRTIRLEGRTTAQFDDGTSQIRNQHVQRASGCDGCDDDHCLRVTGTLVLSYHVTTSVSLPSVNDYPDLTPCQRRRVQDAIDNVLAPHEQEHVRAFETYNGTSEHPFDLRVCNTEQANEQLQAIHDSDAATRETNARAASDALDPFHFDVDLDCEDTPSEGGDESGPGTTPTDEPATPHAPQGTENESEAESERAEAPGQASEP